MGDGMLKILKEDSKVAHCIVFCLICPRPEKLNSASRTQT
jgi:hypothetical protein